MSPKSATQSASLRNGLYVVAVLLLPLLALWHRDNVLYSPAWHADPWFYLGYFKDLVDFKRDLFPGFHAGSRYSWILPGYVVHRLFAPVTSNFILHLTVHSIAVLSLFSILRATAGVRAACLWPGAGFGIVTAAFCGVNYVLDGSLWFLRPAIEIARSYAADWRWPASIWENGGLGPWLWFGAASGIAAVVLLPSRLRKGAIRHNAAGLLFSAQLFATLGCMAYLQYRGPAVLGQYFYASHLLPFVFLTLGTSFWPAAEAMPPRAFIAACCAAAVVFGAIWNGADQWQLPARGTALAGVGALAFALVLRRRQTGTLLAMAGFAILTAGMATEAVQLHGTRAEYERVMQARARRDGAAAGGEQ